ncbi:MAG: hypothetical protein O7C59_00050 [Rickettsia endosymbiont of Ixodes persulcatus]|nr:hypothetical protein [Rickettsia endosymbiont of Ixodes persulcatus]
MALVAIGVVNVEVRGGLDVCASFRLCVALLECVSLVFVHAVLYAGVLIGIERLG